MTKGKILYCASTTSHLKNFHLPYIKELTQRGYSVTACAQQQAEIPYCDDFFAVPFCKQITSPENLKNIIRIYRYLKQEQFIAISVHTTLAAAVVRAAVLLLPKKQRPKVFSTCHGYLFNDNDGLKKWKYLLPEKICASITDVLMTMNQADYQIAKKHHLYKDKLIHIDGMGVDFSRFDIDQSRDGLRKQYSIAEDDVLFVFAGEFSERKNQQELIGAFAEAVKQMPNAKLLLAGNGTLLEQCQGQAKQLGIEDKVVFLGHVQDMPTLYHCSDVCVSASKIEGLPFNIMEAMYCELPCIVSSIKGHSDLVQQGQTGYLYKNEKELSQYMVQFYNKQVLRKQLGSNGKQAVQKYALRQVLPQIMQVYEENL